MQQQQSFHPDDPHHEEHPVNKKLKTRDSQVAELLDEIVHLEKDHLAVEAKLRKQIDLQSSLCENAISYAVLLEQAVIVPAVGSIDSFLASGSGGPLNRTTATTRQRVMNSASNNNNNANNLLETLSEDLKSLLGQFKVGPDFVMAKQRREQIMQSIVDRLKTPMANTSMDVEDALVLVECLLEQQQQLGVLLADSSKKLTGNVDPSGSNNSNNNLTEGEQYEQMKKKEAELSVLQSQLKHLEQLNQTQTSKLQVAEEEIARLSKAARSSGSLEELQKHYQQQEEKYLEKLAAAEKDRENRLQERLAEAARIESLQKMIEESNEEKLVMRGEMDRLREIAVNANRTASQDWSSSTNHGNTRSGSGNNNNNNNSTSSAAEHSLRMELERNIREHSTIVTQLESEIANLRSKLVNTQQESAGYSAQKTHLEQLHRNNELLRQEISQLQQRINSQDNNHAQRDQDAEKIAVMEATIEQLSDEVAAVEARIRSMHAQHVAERERLQQQLEKERNRFQQERDETDALVWRMTSELEYLVKDNALLKAKLEGMQDEQDQLLQQQGGDDGYNNNNHQNDRGAGGYGY